MGDSAGYAHNEISYAKMSLSYAHTYASACPKNGRLKWIALRAPNGGTEIAWGEICKESTDLHQNPRQTYENHYIAEQVLQTCRANPLEFPRLSLEFPRTSWRFVRKSLNLPSKPWPKIWSKTRPGQKSGQKPSQNLTNKQLNIWTLININENQ